MATNAPCHRRFPCALGIAGREKKKVTQSVFTSLFVAHYGMSIYHGNVEKLYKGLRLPRFTHVQHLRSSSSSQDGKIREE